MATITGSQADLDSKIKETKRWLKKQKKQINDLKGLLRTAKQEFSRLQGDLAVYEAARTAGPINTCPSEILSMIFKLAILDKPTHIRRLLLVCRRWHDTVIQDPRLWSFIRLKVPYLHWDVRSWAVSVRPYVRSCLARSSSALLDISLDLVHLWSKREQIKQSLRYKLDENLDITRLYECIDLEDWLRDVDVTTLEGTARITKDCDPRHVFDLIDELIGPKGECLTRWRSGTLALPSDDEMSIEIWNMISRPLPNLSHLNLSNPSFPNFSFDPSEMPYLPRVQRITMSELKDWGFLSFLPTAICELSVESNLNDPFLRQISRLKQLRKLTILETPPKSYSWTVIWSDWPTTQPRRSLSLPLLQDLVVVGRNSGIMGMEFILPALLRLVLEWRCDSFNIRDLPIVRPKLVRWSFVMNPTGGEPDNLAGAPAVLRSILLTYTEAEELSVPFFVKRHLLKVLTKLSSEGNLPSCWKSVSFHNDGDEITEVWVIEEIVS